MITVKGNLGAVKEYPPIEMMHDMEPDYDLSENNNSLFYKYGQSEAYGFSGYSEKISSSYAERVFIDYCSQPEDL